MKNNKLFLLVICLVIVFTGVISFANNTDESKLIDSCTDIGKDFLYKYYYTIDMKEDMNVSKYVSDIKLSQYVDLKQEIMRNRLIRSKVEVSHFSMDISCYDYKVLDTKVEIIYNVLVKHQYTGSDVMSESMQQVKLCFENVGDIISITDYFEFNYFDINFCLEQSKCADTNKALTNNFIENSNYKIDFNDESIKFLEDILAKENEFYDNYNMKVALCEMGESVNNAQPFFDSNYVKLLSVSSTARSNMVTYADNNCDKTSPSSGNSSYASYYDFSEISGAYDCTNFISHCLLAGGASENHNDWYYDSLSSRSYSWAGVNELHDFIVDNTGIGPQAEDRAMSYCCPYSDINWEKGDIIQLQYPNYGFPGYGHSTLITGIYASNYDCFIPMITSRTGDYCYTKNEILTVKYPLSKDILSYRLIHLTNLQ